MSGKTTGMALPALRLTPGLVAGGFVWALLALTGLVGLYSRMTTGHLMAGYGSYVPWGIWVAFYLYGAGIAAGVFIVGGFGFLSGIPGFAARSDLRTTVVLSLAALFPGLLGIGLDLGRLERGARVFLDPNLTSVITLNSWLYTLFMLAAALAWFLSWRKRSEWMRPLVFFGAVLCCIFALGSGMFFATVHVKPYWHNGLWPVMTLVSGLATGSALLLAVRCLSAESAAQAAGCRLARRVLQGCLAAYIVLTILKTILYSPAGAANQLAQPLFSSIWFQIGAGSVIPLLLLLISWRPAWLIAALLALAGMFGGRLDLVLKGQPPVEMVGLPESFEHARLLYAYQPTLMEWQVAALLLAIAVAVFVVGQFVNQVVAKNLTQSGSLGEAQ